MVDRTYYYNDEAQLTYKEKNHLIVFCSFLENYSTYYRTPSNYGEYVPLVHVLNYGNINDKIFYYYDIRASFAYF